MSRSKAARIAGFPVKFSRPALEPLKPATEPTRPAEPIGWDPYEVWRTRVLLPRLQDQAPDSPVQVKSASSAASKK